MFRRLLFCLILMGIVAFSGFGQASAIRDYVGMISQTFHPDIVSYMEKFRRELDKRGYNDAAKSVDNFLKGDSGTGFVYVGSDGKNYILTNFHVISQAHTLSVTFEKTDGEKTKFSDLTIVAADEDMDIALLAFAGGQNPFKQGLAFLSRPLQEGDDVYSAGFPGLGTTMLWQLGRGMVSNISVRLPDNDNPDKMIGPFIQHTAQVDPGNSGGPLLVQTQGVPAGFAVVGINTLSARYRQAANFSIPLNRVQSFLDTSLKSQTADDLTRLNTRLDSFIEGLKAPKAVYSHIATYLANSCIGENAEFALDEMFAKAAPTVRDEIVRAFVRSPVDGMSYAVAWIIENSLRSKTGSISVTVNSITPAGSDRYTVSFNVNNTTIDSDWVNEYGIWRIRTFGDFAAGDKTLIDKRKKERSNAERLVTDPTLRFSAIFAYPFELGGPAAGLDIKLSFTKYFCMGAQAFFGVNNYLQFEGTAGFYVPIKIVGKAAISPFADFGFGMMYNPPKDGDLERLVKFDFGASVKGGLMFTTAAVPGLYLQAAYQRNFYTTGFGLDGDALYPNMFLVGVGYSF
jgi:serine protease Do